MNTYKVKWTTGANMSAYYKGFVYVTDENEDKASEKAIRKVKRDMLLSNIQIVSVEKMNTSCYWF